MVLLFPLLSFLILPASVSPDARPQERIVGGADASLGLLLFQGFLWETVLWTNIRNIPKYMTTMYTVFLGVQFMGFFDFFIMFVQTIPFSSESSSYSFLHKHHQSGHILFFGR